MKPFKPIIKDLPKILHGADYNPDQWQDRPDILAEDMRMMKKAGCNIMSVGIFSWATLEPEEGKYDFSYLDKTIDMLWENGVYVCLATPSGARPAWMSQAHPEVLRVSDNGIRNLHGARHNHCFSSPYYRKKVREMNSRLAQRYKDHPALAVWHISNEYSGECKCDYCVSAFREFIKNKYKTLDNLNKQWWTGFWSHTFTDWEQIEPPSSRGECAMPSLELDWRRFVTYQTVDFMKNEVEPIREVDKETPITTNMMGTFLDIDPSKFREVNDLFSWDSYPLWHSGDPYISSSTAFVHDIMRSLNFGKPFMLMESTPSNVNWAQINKMKKPKMHILSSLQAVAHGADTVQYFQWRKGRGGCEKFHGAVVDHYGGDDTRVFKEVQELGKLLSKTEDIAGTEYKSEVAIVYDWENRWAVKGIGGLKASKKDLDGPTKTYYRPFFQNGVNVDIIQSEDDYSKYKLLILPVLYMLKEGVVGKIEEFVREGGTVVATYLLGQVNENDLCYTGGFPAGKLGEVFGIWAEEIDCLYDNEFKTISMGDKTYKAKDYCEVLHLKGAKSLATFEEDYFKGHPALTCNSYGKGKAYYVACPEAMGELERDLCQSLIEELSLNRAVDCVLPDGVDACVRSDDETDYLFIGNFNDTDVTIPLTKEYTDLFSGEKVSGKISLSSLDMRILVYKHLQ